MILRETEPSAIAFGKAAVNALVFPTREARWADDGMIVIGTPLGNREGEAWAQV